MCCIFIIIFNIIDYDKVYKLYLDNKEIFMSGDLILYFSRAGENYYEGDLLQT